MDRSGKTNRLRPDQLAADIEALNALKAMADYAPANADVSVAKLETARAAMVAEQAKGDQLKAAFDAQRDTTVTNERTFHDLITAAYDAVRGQYGRDSNQVQAMGRKKTSEYKRPVRTKPGTPPTA